MINDNTILSSFNDRPTLLEWLKKVEDALKSDTATAFHVNNRGNATLTFSIDFANGSSLESEPIVLQQGESVIGAEIRNGHLILTLTNGDELDAGDVKPVTSFLINDSQHLIVNYDDGTNQDLGAIFSGNVNIDGNLTANSIIENMPSKDYYLGEIGGGPNIALTYVSVCKNGNKITFVVAGTAKRPTGTSWDEYTVLKLVEFRIPLSVGSKIYTMGAGGGNSIVAGKKISALYSYNKYATLNTAFGKNSDNSLTLSIYGTNVDIFDEEKVYAFRYEETFLLGDNLV